MTDLYKDKVTIYNDIPADAVNPRRFDRFVIDKCQIQGGFVKTTDGTIENIVNAKTVITKDKRYKSPYEYARLPVDIKERYYTAQIGDFIVFSVVDDVITNSKEFSELQAKYRNNGMIITSVTAYTNGLKTDNVTMTNA
jgi:hypothetical protein